MAEWGGWSVFIRFGACDWTTLFCPSRISSLVRISFTPPLTALVLSFRVLLLSFTRYRGVVTYITKFSIQPRLHILIRFSLELRVNFHFWRETTNMSSGPVFDDFIDEDGDGIDDRVACTGCGNFYMPDSVFCRSVSSQCQGKTLPCFLFTAFLM